MTTNVWLCQVSKSLDVNWSNMITLTLIVRLHTSGRRCRARLEQQCEREHANIHIG